MRIPTEYNIDDSPDGTLLPADYFAFRTESEVEAFAQRAVNENEELGSYSFIKYRERFPWWFANLKPLT